MTTSSVDDAVLHLTGLPELQLGTQVEVRRRFDQEWARGFEVAGAADDGYHLRRTSDGSVLPVVFPTADVRRSQGSRNQPRW